MGKTLAFVVGGAVGAAVGAAVSAVMAPQDGKTFQANVQTTINEAKVAGDAAKTETEEAFRERFRIRVDDPSALKADV